MVTPKRVRTRTQPIAVDGAARYSAGGLTLPEASRGYLTSGGPVLQWVMMLRRAAVCLSAAQPALGRPLAGSRDRRRHGYRLRAVASVTNEVVVRDHSIRELLPLDPMRNGEGRAEGLSERPQAELR